MKLFQPDLFTWDRRRRVFIPTKAAAAAAPQYAAKGTTVGSPGITETTKNLPRPTSGGTGVGVVDVIFIYNEDGTATITPPAGDNLQEAPDSPVIVTGTRAHKLHVYWKQASDSTGNYVFGFNPGAYLAGVAIRYTGANSTDPWDVTASAIDTTTLHNTSPAISDTTTVANTLLLWAGTQRNLTDTSSSAADSMNERSDVGTSGCGLAVDDLAQANAGPTGTIQSTWAASNAMTAWLGALKPA